MFFTPMVVFMSFLNSYNMIDIDIFSCFATAQLGTICSIYTDF